MKSSMVRQGLNCARAKGTYKSAWRFVHTVLGQIPAHYATHPLTTIYGVPRTLRQLNRLTLTWRDQASVIPHLWNLISVSGRIAFG